MHNIRNASPTTAKCHEEGDIMLKIPKNKPPIHKVRIRHIRLINEYCRGRQFGFKRMGICTICR